MDNPSLGTLLSTDNTSLLGTSGFHVQGPSAKSQKLIRINIEGHNSSYYPDLELEKYMSQLVDNHPLARDLPEHKDSIHKLKMSDAHFARILSEYEGLDKQIVRIEQLVESASDHELDELKMKRVHAKDYLMKMVRASEA